MSSKQAKTLIYDMTVNLQKDTGLNKACTFMDTAFGKRMCNTRATEQDLATPPRKLNKVMSTRRGLQTLWSSFLLALCKRLLGKLIPCARVPST